METPHYFVCNPYHESYVKLPKRRQPLHYDIDTHQYTIAWTTCKEWLDFWKWN